MVGSNSLAVDSLAALSRYFTLEAHDWAHDNKALLELYALRYQVYCLERDFLSPEKYPGGLESDEDDSRSVHFAARNRDGVVAGTARLVLGSSGEALPFEEHCPASVDFSPPPPTFTAEVSRLAVSKAYRRRVGDTPYGVNARELGKPAGNPDGVGRERRSNAPLLVLGLYRQMYRYSREHGIRYWYAAMERSLARVLGLYGFDFKPIGEERDYYGPVRPYLGDLDLLEKELQASNPALLAWFRSGP